MKTAIKYFLPIAFFVVCCNEPPRVEKDDLRPVQQQTTSGYDTIPKTDLMEKPVYSDTAAK